MHTAWSAPNTLRVSPAVMALAILGTVVLVFNVLRVILKRKSSKWSRSYNWGFWCAWRRPRVLERREGQTEEPLLKGMLRVPVEKSFLVSLALCFSENSSATQERLTIQNASHVHTSKQKRQIEKADWQKQLSVYLVHWFLWSLDGDRYSRQKKATSPGELLITEENTAR